MSKIKLNLVSGVAVEKPLINAFNANQNKYLVLDNEMNGSMGYPIILVSKIVDNKVVKIADPSEWESVKECLKQIIAGNNLDYFAVDPVMSADDIYYTQLTLPVTSFDALKNAYKVNVVEEANVLEPAVNVPIMENNETNNLENTNINPNEPVMSGVAPMPNNFQPNIEAAPVFNYNEPSNVNPSVMPNPVSDIPVAPVVEPVTQNVVPEVSPMNDNQVTEPTQTFVNPNPINIEMPTFDSVNPVSDVAVAPMTEFNATLHVNDEHNVVSEPVMPVNPITPEPVVSPVENTIFEPVNNEELNKTDVFASQKEAFMEACSNMFDALVQKFEKELNKNKQN